MNEELPKKPAAALPKPDDSEPVPADERPVAPIIVIGGILITIGSILGYLTLTSLVYFLAIHIMPSGLVHDFTEIYTNIFCCLGICPDDGSDYSDMGPHCPEHDLNYIELGLSTDPQGESYTTGDAGLVAAEHLGVAMTTEIPEATRLSPGKAPADAAPSLVDMSAEISAPEPRPGQTERLAVVASDTAAVAVATRHPVKAGPEIPVPTQTPEGEATPANEARTDRPPVDFAPSSNETLAAAELTTGDAMPGPPAEVTTQRRAIPAKAETHETAPSGQLRATGRATDDRSHGDAEIAESPRTLDEALHPGEANGALRVRERAMPERFAAPSDAPEGIRIADTPSGDGSGLDFRRGVFGDSFVEHQFASLQQTLATERASSPAPRFTPEYEATHVSYEWASFAHSAPCTTHWTMARGR